MKVFNLEKTARSSSKVTNAKNQVYRFIAAMLAFADNGIMLNKSQALNPDKLAEFLSNWKRVSKTASLNHIVQIEGPVLEEFTLLKDVFIDAQVGFKLRSFENARPYLTPSEVTSLETAIGTYNSYVRDEVKRMTKRVSIATPKAKKAKTPKKTAAVVAQS